MKGGIYQTSRKLTPRSDGRYNIQGNARLRISLSAAQSEESIQLLAAALAWQAVSVSKSVGGL